MNKSAIVKLALVLVLLAAAALNFSKLGPARERDDGNAYFYDLAEQKLFVAPRSSIPPILGIKRGELTGVRAIVISANGDPKDKASRKIAYLEKYSPDLKQVLESVRAGKTTDVPSHSERQGRIFVRRFQDPEWYSVNSPEGEKIMTEWNVAGPEGKFPVVCAP
jgi:hypothetical protein